MKITYISILLLVLIIGSEASHLSNNALNSSKSKNKARMSKKEMLKNQKIQNLKNKYHNNIQVTVSQENDDVSEEQDVIDILPQKAETTQDNEWVALAKQSATFEEFYAAYQQLLQDDLSEQKTDRANKAEECNSYTNEITQLEVNISKAEDYIAWLVEKVAENNTKIDKIYGERCEAHGIFIEYYKNSKITLRLIEFLKVAITNYSMVQLKQVGNILSEFMNPRLMSNQEAIKTMLTQLKQVDSGVEKFDQTGGSLNNQSSARTDEEIGQGHVDNTNQEQINVDEFQSTERRLLDSYKEEINQILDTLASNLNAELQRRQDDEIELNDRVVVFVERMEIENQHLTEEADNQRATLIQMKNDLQTLTVLSETCEADLVWIDEVIVAQEDIIAATVTNKEQIRENYISIHLAESIKIVVLDDPNVAQSITLEDTNTNTDSGNTDTGSGDNTGNTNTDSGNTDSGNTDSGNTDSGNTDSGNTDSGNTDSGNTDSGNTDSGNTDSGNTDSGNTDSGNTDSGNTDSGNTDSGNTDSGNTDTVEEVVYEDTTDWDPTSGDVYTLQAGTGGAGIKIPDVALEGLVVGLSWESQNDIDSAIIIADSNHEVIERVYWDNTESTDDLTSVVYNGDARQGDASGDDETTDIYLMDADESYMHIFVLVTLYDDYTYFQDVVNTQLRIYVDDVPFLEYQLDPLNLPQSENASGVFLVEFYRNTNDADSWYLRPVEIWSHTAQPSGVDLRAANQNMIDAIITAYGEGTALPDYAEAGIV